jgi:hypothetical protein
MDESWMFIEAKQEAFVMKIDAIATTKPAVIQ